MHAQNLGIHYHPLQERKTPIPTTGKAFFRRLSTLRLHFLTFLKFDDDQDVKVPGH